MEWADAGGWRTVECTVWFADDNLNSPDYVGTKEYIKTFEYRLALGPNGELIDAPGEWLGVSVDDHPDFMWFPESLNEEPLIERDKLDAILNSTIDAGSDEPSEENDTLYSAHKIQTPVSGRFYIGRLQDPDWFRLDAYEGDSLLAYAFATFSSPPELDVSFFTVSEDRIGTNGYHMDYIDIAPYTGSYYVKLDMTNPQTYRGDKYNVEFSQWPVTLVPHVPHPINWQTELTLYNPGDIMNGLYANLFEGDNQLISERRIDIAAKGLARVPAVTGSMDFDGGKPHYLRLTNTLYSQSAPPPAPLASVTYQADGQCVDLPLTTAEDSEQTTLYIPHIELSGQWWNGLILQNLDAAEPLQADFYCYDKNGNRLVTEQGGIPPGENRADLLTEFFNQAVPPGTGWIEVAASAPITGGILWGNASNASDPGLCGMPLLSENHAAETLYIPHLAVDNGWWTGVGFINPRDHAATITLEGFQSNGQPVASGSLVVAGKGKWCDLIQNAFTDWQSSVAWVKVTADRPITGFQLFGREKTQMAAMRLQGPDDLDTELHVCLPAAHDSLWSGIGLLNPGNDSTHILIEPYDEEGLPLTPQGRWQLGQLERNQNRVALTEQFFSQGLPDGTAYLVIRAENGETEIGGMGLYQAAGSQAFDRLFVRPFKQ